MDLVTEVVKMLTSMKEFRSILVVDTTINLVNIITM
jgi:hypothetical protein